LSAQKAALAAAGPPSAEARIDRLSRAIALLTGHAGELCAALSADFGWRSPDSSLLTDVVASVAHLKHARAQVRGWMKPSKRKVEPPLNLLGAKAEVRFQPKGVVGVIAPWNFPVYLAFAPLAGVLAAGNSALLKFSELAPATADLLERLIRLNFDETELAVILGGAEVGAGFTKLPFDHLVFTGSARVGRAVMAAAAENLTPVTLELGGKSPAILGDSADLAIAATRIMAGKLLNAGQTCLAPDYVLAPRARIEPFVEAARAATARLYPSLKDNRDYTAIASAAQYERLHALIADAASKGARVIEINPRGEDFSTQEFRKLPPIFVLDPTEDMDVLREEIFGPVLPIVGYDRLEDAIAFVNARPHPLALYYFGQDEAECETVLARTNSGGVTINDVIYHIAQDDLPFGGAGASGMGRYHGVEGFLEFSHQRGVYRQARSELIARLRPPYGEPFRDFMRDRLKE
jgi:coniferyl-aldehyde dehydrogenase